MNRDISISDLVIFLSMLGALSLAWGKLDTRVSLLEQAQSVQVQANDRTTTRIESNIQEINQKLDRLLMERRQ